MIAALIAVASAQADTGLRRADAVTPKPAGAAEPVARASADSDAPLRLEYELITRIEHMTKTTQELQNIVAALPGPSLPPGKSPPLPAVHYASAIEETRGRLNHVEQLIADITRIIMAMPFSGKPVTPPPSPVPSTPAPATPVKPTASSAPPAPVTPTPAPPVVPTAPAPVAPPPPAAMAPAATPDAAPAPAPKPAAEPVKQAKHKLVPLPEPTNVLNSETIIRGILLALGSVVAAVLAIVARRRFLARNPTRKQLAASIGNVPIKDEALELADVMTEMGMGEGAAETLVERIRANPRQALTHWLKLLDVYRKTGKQTEFEKAADEMRTAFNVKPGIWDRSQDADDKDATVENYPHIAKQLKELWPKPECSEFLLSLLADNRDGKREGFPLAVIEEIVLLLAVLRGDEVQAAEKQPADKA